MGLFLFFLEYYLITAIILAILWRHMLFGRNFRTRLSGGDAITHFKLVYRRRCFHVYSRRSCRHGSIRSRHRGILLQFVARGSSQSSSRTWNLKTIKIKIETIFAIISIDSSNWEDFSFGLYFMSFFFSCRKY